MPYDLIIRNGLVVDGSGGTPFQADIAVDAGYIAALGRVESGARNVIDARGHIVTPGFVDVHTHYDGQVLWEDRLIPSSEHGVTTVVMGNCAVGFAPCRPSDRDLLLKVMAGVEDIPEAVMANGLKWNWETFPEYLDVLAERRCDVDFAAQLPHGPVRVYAMGKRGADRELATYEDLAKMTAIVEEALAAGAIGISSSRTIAHRAVDGQMAPTETSSEAELLALARGMRAAGTGVIEYITDFPGLPYGDTTDFDLMRRMGAIAGRPLSFTLLQLDFNKTGWRRLLDLVEIANAEGVRIRGQVSARAVGLYYGLSISFNPFSFRASYKEIEHLPVAERARLMRDPERKRKILEEPSIHPNGQVVWLTSLVDKMFVVDGDFDYEPAIAKRLGERARAAGVTPWELAYDALLEKDGQALLYLPITNYSDGSLDAVLEMLRHPDTVMALGDGGAHYGIVCDASYPTFALAHWARDRKGERIPLPEVVRALSREPAISVGLMDRGLIHVGYKADMNIIDFERLKLRKLDVRDDLPGGGRRIVQSAEGYVATVVSGEVTYRDGVHTGCLPGRLVRGAKADPMALGSVPAAP